MDDSKILMKSIFPDLVNKIKQVFAVQDRRDLYEQINDLVIVSLCKCGEESCGSFYTVDPPDENTEHKVEDFKKIADFRKKEGLESFVKNVQTLVITDAR